MPTTAAPSDPERDATPEVRSAWTEVNGLTMHARIAEGAGAVAPPVVLVHGVGVSSRYMLPTLRRLAASYRVYAPDLPGFGRSDHPPDVLGPAPLADALAAWMGVMGLGDAVVLGNSMGCQVAVDLALRHPERVGRLVLTDPTGDPEAQAVTPVLLWGALDVLGEPPSLWPRLVLDYFLAGPLRTLRTLRRALAVPMRHKLPEVRVPALVVRGGRDRIVSQCWVEEVARLLPRGELLVIPDATHAANFSAPDALARAVHSFLARHPPLRLGGFA
jgi:pimeloyl-ACP methyl ester carboxylesterase